MLTIKSESKEYTVGYYTDAGEEQTLDIMQAALADGSLTVDADGIGHMDDEAAEWWSEYIEHLVEDEQELARLRALATDEDQAEIDAILSGCWGDEWTRHHDAWIEAREKILELVGVAVDYEGGGSRTHPGMAVDYMLVVIDGAELYAERPAQDEEDASYSELREDIVEQAREAGIDPIRLVFWRD